MPLRKSASLNTAKTSSALSYLPPGSKCTLLNRGEFLEGWIPGNYLSKVLVPSWTRYSRIDAKNLARRVLGTDLIPDLAYHFNGSWIDRDHQHIPPADLKARILSDHDAVFVRLNRSSRGRGVWKIDRSDFDAEKLAALGDFVIHSPIQQHPFFDRFSADSVATLRITTVKQRGLRAVKKASYLRLGRSGAQHIRSDAQFRIPIVDDLGTLGPRGADASWASFSAHPDSNEEFSGQLVPGFESAVQLCETLHDQTPVTILIGWDIAIDPAGMPVLMEWNQGAAATKFSEASVGPCFRNLGWEDIWRSQR